MKCCHDSLTYIILITLVVFYNNNIFKNCLSLYWIYMSLMVCVTGQYQSRTIDWQNCGASYDVYNRPMALCSFKLQRIGILYHAYI